MEFYLEAKTPELHVMTYANKPHVGLNYLVESCAYNGIELCILGIGSASYMGPPLPFPDYLEKVRVTLEALNKGSFADDDIVMFVDAFDVLILIVYD